MRILPLALISATLVTLVALGAAPADAQAGPSVDWIQPSDTHSYVLGDSISEQDAPLLRERRPDWSINALGGRPVSKLRPLVENLVAADPFPALVVIELGSNNKPGWTKLKYTSALGLLPSTTKVLLVTPYKAPGSGWGSKGVKATAQYAAWMEQIANTRPHTCVVAWRAAAAAHPEWLRDGLHGTSQGYQELTRMIVERSQQCV